MTERVECPCCKGEKYLWVVDQNFPEDHSAREKCCHCDGKGYVEGEELAKEAKMLYSDAGYIFKERQ